MTGPSAVMLSRRDTEVRELMDDPDCDPDRLRRTLERFAIVNRLVAGWGRAYRRHVRPALAAAEAQMTTTAPLRVLDIGCGGGDVLRHLVVLARADGFVVEALGIDPDARALAVATAAAATVPGISYRRAHSSDLVTEGAHFDVVVSNHVLHHLTDAERDALLADSASLARHLAVHSDIERSAVAYAGYSVGILPFAPGTFLRTDGLRSIRRSHTRDELAAAVPAGWTVERGPFRLLAVHRPEHGTP